MRIRLPDGGVTDFYEGADGVRLRAIRWTGGDPARGHILYAGGKRDFIERHAETYHRLLRAGYRVTAIDWRDQGLSARGSVPDGHLFDAMASDFLRIVSKVADGDDLPLIPMAHSMGGHMVLRSLAEVVALRKRVARAVLFAPMLGIASGLRSWVLSAVARTQTRLGNGRGRPPGQPEYGPAYRSQVRCDRLTGDRARFDEGFGFIDAEPGLAAGGATWGWLAGAFRSMARLRRPGVLEAVETPMLILLGTDERIVDPGAIERAAQRLPHAQLRIIEGGRHELQLDRNAVQTEIWTAVESFLT